MRSIRKIRHLENVPVLVRAALNVPVADGKVVNTFRLRQAVPTIEYLRKKHARVILIGHIGDTGVETLEPVADAMREFFPKLIFSKCTTGPEARAAVRATVPGDVLVLENLRRYAGEKGNDPAFAAELAELADVFVQDSFDVCHRKHASVVGVPELLPSYAGLQLEIEVQELKKALAPKRPSLAIIGGAKFSTKKPVIKTLLARYDRVFVGGALSNDFLRAKGYPMEASLVSKEDHESICELLQNPKLVVPSDEIYAVPGAPPSQSKEGLLDGKAPFEAVLDHGPRTMAMLESMVESARTILWNGPLGNYEKGYVAGTERLARAIAKSHAHSVIGGGDTIAAVEKLGLSTRFSFISTGGGAMLDFMAHGTLPGIDALS